MRYYSYKWKELVHEDSMSFCIFWKLYHAITLMEVETVNEIRRYEWHCKSVGKWDFFDMLNRRIYIEIPTHILTEDELDISLKKSKLQYKYAMKQIKERRNNKVKKG